MQLGKVAMMFVVIWLEVALGKAMKTACIVSGISHQTPAWGLIA